MASEIIWKPSNFPCPYCSTGMRRCSNSYVSPTCGRSECQQANYAEHMTKTKRKPRRHT